MKRIISILLALAMILPGGALAAKKKTKAKSKEFNSAHEVYQEVQTALAEGNGDGTINLDTKSGTVTFSVRMPDVETVPILRFTAATKDMFPEKGPEGTTTTAPPFFYTSDQCFEVFMGDIAEVIGEEVKGHTSRIRSGELDFLPEGSPFDHCEAIVFFEQWLKSITEERGWDFRPANHAIACSRSYKAVDHGQGFIPLLDEPFSGVGHDTGYYEITFRQYLHGIPYWRDAAVLSPPGKKYCIDVEGEANSWLLSPEHYFFFIEPVIETGVLAEDIPLASFTKVLKSLENIPNLKGNNLRFGYYRRYDPDDPEHSAIAVPTWIFMTDYFSYDVYYINAQTGELFDPYTDNSPWIEWKAGQK